MRRFIFSPILCVVLALLASTHVEAQSTQILASGTRYGSSSTTPLIVAMAEAAAEAELKALVAATLMEAELIQRGYTVTSVKVGPATVYTSGTTATASCKWEVWGIVPSPGPGGGPGSGND